MTPRMTPEDLGAPALRVAGFQLWIHGRENPGADDYDDGNWLRVTAHCGARGASVWAEGSIVMVTDIAGFGRACQALLRGDATEALLEPIEPGFGIRLRCVDRLGHLSAHIDITPEHLTQSHTIEFEIDQSYLPGIVAACSRIVDNYPVRGQQTEGA